MRSRTGHDDTGEHSTIHQPQIEPLSGERVNPMCRIADQDPARARIGLRMRARQLECGSLASQLQRTQNALRRLGQLVAKDIRRHFESRAGISLRAGPDE